jgi:Transcriptional regulator
VTRNASAKWDDLRIFLEVARQGSVQAAARRLKLDHSTVGRRIEYLESVLTVKLLDRTRKGVVVREEAKALLAHIEQMDMQASSLEDAVAGARATQVVRIATMEGLASCYVARRLLAAAVRAGCQVGARQHPADGGSVTQGGGHIPELLQSQGSRARERAVRHVQPVPVLLAGYARRHGIPRNRDELQHHVFTGYIDDLLAIHAVRGWMSSWRNRR